MNEVKNALLQETCFLNGLMFNLLFYCHITLYWEKVTSYEKFNRNSKLCGTFQCINAIDGTIKMLKND